MDEGNRMLAQAGARAPGSAEASGFRSDPRDKSRSGTPCARNSSARKPWAVDARHVRGEDVAVERLRELPVSCRSVPPAVSDRTIRSTGTGRPDL